MLAWKYWDVALAIFGFFIQCGLAYMGLTMTHWKHKAFFFGLVLLGGVFTGIAVKRGVDSANTVQTQLNNIEHNTETPPQVTVNIPPASPPEVIISPPQAEPHKSQAFMQLTKMEAPPKLEANSRLHFNLHLQNTGKDPAYSAYAKFSDAIATIPNPSNVAESTEIDAKMHSVLLQSALKAYRDEVKAGNKGVTVAIGGDLWNTTWLGPLSQKEVDEIVSGHSRLYIFAWSRWNNNQADLEYCVSLQSGNPNIEGGAIWHIC